MTAELLRQDAEEGDRAAVYQNLMATGLFDAEHAERITDSLLAAVEEEIEEAE